MSGRRSNSRSRQSPRAHPSQQPPGRQPPPQIQYPFPLGSQVPPMQMHPGYDGPHQSPYGNVGQNPPRMYYPPPQSNFQPRYPQHRSQHVSVYFKLWSTDIIQVSIETRSVLVRRLFCLFIFEY